MGVSVLEVAELWGVLRGKSAGLVVIPTGLDTE